MKKGDLERDGRLPADIVGLDRLSNPVWVFDPASNRKLYANPSAVALWGAASLHELRARDFSTKSEAARIRTEQTLAAVIAGERKSDVWTFFPQGIPVTVRTVSSHLLLRDGTSTILFEATVADDPADHLRALAAVRHIETLVSFYDENGLESFGNPHAVTAYGDRRTFLERCHGSDARDAWTTALDKGRFRGRLEMLTDAGVAWHDVTLQRTVDPVTGKVAILSVESDDSEKVETEAALALQAEALAQARECADAANQAKSVFLANMSHEIRTPLNGVVGLADLLCRSDLSSTQREAAEVIRSSGRSLERLLADILQLAQIEAGEIALVDEPFDIACVARDVTDLLKLKAEENGSTLSLDVTLSPSETRWGDPLRFRQIVTNLTANAVKFTRGGSVMLMLEPYGDGVRLMVKDTGVGFDEDQKSRLFERFQQADGSITRRFGGTGLGLAITADLVDRMGGKIGCDSTPGLGSRFWVELPLPVGHGSTEPSLPDCEITELEGLRVLVADDHPVNRRVLEMILKPLGADVVSVENGIEAVEATTQTAFDVVLMDMQMPVMDGLSATRRIAAAGGPPVIMVSANGMPDHVEAAMTAGAVAHITKPIEPSELIEAISTTLHDARTVKPSARPRRRGIAD